MFSIYSRILIEKNLGYRNKEYLSSHKYKLEVGKFPQNSIELDK